MMKITTGSQNTIKAYEFLKENAANSFSIKEVAEALGLTSAQVTGGLVSLAKKGAVTKEDGMRDDKPYKVFQYAEDVEFEVKDANKMSDKAVQLLQFLQKKGDIDMTAQDIADELDMAAIAINGVVNGLAKRNLVERQLAVFEMPDGEEREIKLIKLTDEGAAYKF